MDWNGEVRRVLLGYWLVCIAYDVIHMGGGDRGVKEGVC